MSDIKPQGLLLNSFSQSSKSLLDDLKMFHVEIATRTQHLRPVWPSDMARTRIFVTKLEYNIASKWSFMITGTQQRCRSGLRSGSGVGFIRKARSRRHFLNMR